MDKRAYLVIVALNVVLIAGVSVLLLSYDRREPVASPRKTSVDGDLVAIKERLDRLGSSFTDLRTAVAAGASRTNERLRSLEARIQPQVSEPSPDSPSNNGGVFLEFDELPPQQQSSFSSFFTNPRLEALSIAIPGGAQVVALTPLPESEEMRGRFREYCQALSDETFAVDSAIANLVKQGSIDLFETELEAVGHRDQGGIHGDIFAFDGGFVVVPPQSIVADRRVVELREKLERAVASFTAAHVVLVSSKSYQ